MGYNVHDFWRRVVVYYTRNIKILKKIKIGMNFFIILKDGTQNLQWIGTFSNVYIYSKIEKRVIYLNNYMHFS
jgi:hypothetical protein